MLYVTYICVGFEQNNHMWTHVIDCKFTPLRMNWMWNRENGKLDPDEDDFKIKAEAIILVQIRHKKQLIRDYFSYYYHMVWRLWDMLKRREKNGWPAGYLI